jgi:signal transduction histidine kinase
MPDALQTTDPSPPLPYWHEPERVIAVLRILVVLSMAMLVGLGSPIDRTYPMLGWTVVSLAGVYSGVVLLAHLRDWSLLSQDLITTLDGSLTVALIAATGGSESLVTAILPLAIVASAARQGLRRALLAALGTGIAFSTVVLLVPDRPRQSPPPLEAALWWMAYLVAFAILTGTLRKILDQEHGSAVHAKAEVLSEHYARLEERDLRARLLRAQQDREDGLRIVLHEFRTPVSSVGALAVSLTTRGRLDAEQQRTAIDLIGGHARHLVEMLDGLADVAISTGDPRGPSRVRQTRLEDLAWASLDAAGVPPEHGKVSVTPVGAVANCDDHRLRRVMTNLIENAYRHSGAQTVEVTMTVSGRTLKIEVADRGPGLPAGQATLVTRKFVSQGEKAGTAGLGLWIVEQLITAMAGSVVLEPRTAGGLVARIVIPLWQQ